MNHRPKDSIIDSLFLNDSINIEEGDTEIYIPRKCKQCNNAIICNILPAAIGFSRIGVKMDIVECPFFPSSKNATNI